jgi:mRNA interferase MazF
VKYFDKWNKIKKLAEKTESPFIIDEGDIRWCKFGVNVGYEITGKGETFSRPVLIIKKFSRDVFWGVPITTKNKKGSWFFYIKQINRVAILNQMKLFDRKDWKKGFLLI